MKGWPKNDANYILYFEVVLMMLFLTMNASDQLLQQMDTSDTKSFISQIQSIKKLILPQEMGELFKVIGLTKDIDLQLLGFSAQDQRYRL